MTLRPIINVAAGTARGSWVCHAQPAPSGRVCGHINATGGTVVNVGGLVCCDKCGCTKTASDDRLARKLAAEQPR